ncbi:MAG: endonuclease/exonuclease/phosphatase family protein [Paludibacteraceae bacterium]|nr:endonuclease/exonuclease/phosphatase family protein [Paludibacteraceae bacterium]
MKNVLRVIGLLCFALLVGAALLVVSHRCAYPKSPIEKGEQPIRQILTILTYNTHRMGTFLKPEKNAVIQYLKTVDADILCLQEVEVYNEDQYLTESELMHVFCQYPYHYVDFRVRNRRRNFGHVIFSRYPLLNRHRVEYSSRSNSSLVTDVVVNEDTLRLISNHLESTRIEQRDIDSVFYTYSLSHGDLETKLKNSSSLRRNQAKAVRKEIKQSPFPVVVVGDFNAVPWSYTYLMIRGTLKDCFLHCSNLHLGRTMDYLHLPLRIDYVLCSSSLTPWNFTIEQPQGSDHFPVKATIVW